MGRGAVISICSFKRLIGSRVSPNLKAFAFVPSSLARGGGRRVVEPRLSKDSVIRGKIRHSNSLLLAVLEEAGQQSSEEADLRWF